MAMSRIIMSMSGNWDRKSLMGDFPFSFFNSLGPYVVRRCWASS